ncbi:MAG: ATP-binding protein [Acidimicrobiia bacterium]|nr:ATP-binding protein [Acidimicrobiia bacterium]
MVFKRVMTVGSPRRLRLEFSSIFDMVDVVQVISDHVSREIGLDEDATHWVGVAIRECVINAIKHGNRHDSSKHVFVEFTIGPVGVPTLVVSVRDQGAGFDPAELQNPLAPENLLKSSGRGIFLIRSFMDDVQLMRAPQGGMEVRMTKRVQPALETDSALHTP